MTSPYATALLHLLAAMTAGALIGLERTFHGRPAGFRTHTLVCTAASLLMLLTIYPVPLLPGLSSDLLRTDAVRMAQGIMTGIGFLGAGVIMKEGLSIRGLTTAASIWMTASIGVLMGIGFFFPAMVATALALATLSLFRWIEGRMPYLAYAHLKARFRRTDYLSEDELNAIIREHAIRGGPPSFYLAGEGQYVEYQLTLRSRKLKNFHRLAATLLHTDKVLEFAITPVSEK